LIKAEAYPTRGSKRYPMPDSHSEFNARLKAIFLVAQDIFFTCSAVSCWIFFRSCSTLFGYNYCCCINLSLFI